MPTTTSAGQPLTRNRLQQLLEGLPVHVTFTARNRPFSWSIEHALDRARQFHPYNRMDDQQFAQACDPDIEEASRRLAEAGYHVTLRPDPDPVDLEQLPEQLRTQFAGTHPRLVLRIIPDQTTPTCVPAHH